MLALAGGAAMLGRGKKKFGTDAGFLTSGAAGGARLSTPPIGGTDHIVSSPKYIARKTPIKKDNTITRTSGIKRSDSGQTIGAAGVDSSGLSRGERAQILAAKGRAPKGIIRPGSVPMQDYYSGNINQFDYRAKGGRAGHKSGGSVRKASVTGAAKRGFGRALMKGKK